MISKELKKRDMKFVGTTIVYSFLQAIGIIEKVFTPKEIKTKIHAEQILEYINK